MRKQILFVVTLLIIYVQSNVIQTERGPVRGTESDRAYIWRGIPFAAPPVRDLRWKSPQPHPEWTEVRNTTEFGASCLQLNLAISPLKWQSEDCLTLNIWVPKKFKSWNEEPNKLYPVMVWSHGGAFRLGSATDFNGMYFGEHLASIGEVIVVTYNYRLGPLGYLSHRYLRQESQFNTSGNYAIQDGIAVHQWVKDNIRNFKGDPDNISAFGESAGASHALLFAFIPQMSGLVHKVILQSPPNIPYAPVEMGERQGDGYAAALQCTQKEPEKQLECMRKVPAQEAMFAHWNDPRIVFWHSGSDPEKRTAWVPSIDGYFVPGHPLKLVETKSLNKVSVMIGTNTHEGSLFYALTFLLMLPKVDEILYKSVLSIAFPDIPQDRLLALYPIDNYDNLKDALIDVHTDSLWLSAAIILAEKLGSHEIPTYVYQFSQEPSLPSIPRNLGMLGCHHGAELNFIFHNFPFGTDKEYDLAMQMMHYWANFAKSGNPNTPVKTNVTWPMYSAESPKTINFKNPITVETDFRKEYLDLWKEYYPYGITTVEKLDLIDEPFVSYLVNHHGKAIFMWVLKQNKRYLVVGGLTIVLFVARFVIRLLSFVRRKKQVVAAKKPKKE